MQNRLYILRIILPALLAAASLASCRKDPSPVPAGDTAIAFSSSVSGTKALINSVKDVTAFKVYGYYTIDGTASHTAFDGTAVTRAGALWQYSPARYWLPGAKYSFAAFHPADASVRIVNPDIDENGVFEKLSFEYEKTGFYDDFMLASASMTTDEAAGKGYQVGMCFSHILSNIKINIGFADDVQNGTSIRITRAEINGMKSSGTYTVGQGWSDLSTTSLQLTSNIPDVVLKKIDDKVYNNDTELTDGTISLTGDEGLTVIPVDLTENSNAVRIILNCEISIDGINYTAKRIEKTIRATGSVPAWLEGKSYTYKALLDVDYSISFAEPTVTAWEDEQATGSVIIK